MAPIITRPQYLVVASYVFGTGAADITSFWALHQMTSLDGENKAFDGGVRNYRKFETTTQYRLPGQVYGHVAPDGTPWGDPVEGLEANIDEIHATVGTIPETRAGTVAAEWHRRDGSVWDKDIQVVGFAPTGAAPGLAKFTLTIECTGRFVRREDP